MAKKSLPFLTNKLSAQYQQAKKNRHNHIFMHNFKLNIER